MTLSITLYIKCHYTESQCAYKERDKKIFFVFFDIFSKSSSGSPNQTLDLGMIRLVLYHCATVTGHSKNIFRVGSWHGASTLSITTLSIATLSMATLSIATLSIKGLMVTLSMNDTQ